MLILSGVTYYLTSNSLEYQGLLISKVMDGIEVIQLTNDDSGIDLNVSGNFIDKVLEKYLPERRQKMNQELRFISPRKYNTFRLLFQIFYCSIFHCKFLKMLDITLSSFLRKNLCTYWIWSKMSTKWSYWVVLRMSKRVESIQENGFINNFWGGTKQ